MGSWKTDCIASNAFAGRSGAAFDHAGFSDKAKRAQNDPCAMVRVTECKVKWRGMVRVRRLAVQKPWRDA